VKSSWKLWIKSVFLSQSDLKQLQKNKLHFKNSINNSGTQAFFLRSSLYSLSESLFYLLIIPVLSALILYYRQLLAKVLYQLFPAGKIIHEILIETIRAYYNFIKGMLIVYLIVGLLNSIGLLIVGTTSFYVWFYFYTHLYSLHRHHDIFSFTHCSILDNI
jgi:predicted PurR-regulated permease PerM